MKCPWTALGRNATKRGGRDNMPTKIEWAEETWNPVTGCSPISEGCRNCYAKRMANRLRDRFGYPDDDPFRVTLHPERLNEPLRWKISRRVFVCSMGDLFHDDVPEDFINKVFSVMLATKEHTYILLTKRPQRAYKYLTNPKTPHLIVESLDVDLMDRIAERYEEHQPFGEFPLNNVWLGVTAENQQAADERIPILLQIPAAVRFVSVEPMLGPVDLTSIRFDRHTIMNVLEGSGTNRLSPYQSIRNAFCNRINWIICGGETGPGARPMHPDWVRSLVLQCINAGVPFFFKSWGEWMPSYQTGDTFELSRLKTDEVVMSGPGHGVVMKKVGKKAAGYLLDGEEWNQYPEVRA